MELKSDWKLIVKKAWSMRFMALSALAGGIAALLLFIPELYKLSLAQIIGLIILSMAFNFLAMYSRVIAQKDL
jgi:hypothetical protein